MFDSKETADFFATTAKVLLRCWLFGFVLLLIWLASVLLMGSFIDPIQTSIFRVSQHELDVITYCGIGFLKLFVLLFFFFPWLAIKLALRPGKT